MTIHDPSTGGSSREAGRLLTLGIVHELNNLTGGIVVLSELLQGDESGLPVGDGLALLHQSTTRLQTLVRHLRIINGPISGEPAYVNLPAAIRDALEMFLPLLPKDMPVDMQFPDEEMAACLDEALLRHALLGLILNLRDALASRPALARKMRAELHRQSDDNAELTLGLGDGPAGGTDVLVSESELREAREKILTLGGELTTRADGEIVVALPLAA